MLKLRLADFLSCFPLYICVYIQKEIQNDEDSQISSVLTRCANQEKNRDLKKEKEFPEMKGALRQTICRTQVKFCSLKNIHF